MTPPQIESIPIADCEIRPERDNARLEMNRRARGVRYARMRSRMAWFEAHCTTREAHYTFVSSIYNP